MATTPTVASREPSSRRMVATAATQGVYSRVNTRKLTADSGENSPASAGPRLAVLVFSSTDRVDTTASLAVKPEIRAVTTRQSPKPRGAKMGASH